MRGFIAALTAILLTSCAPLTSTRAPIEVAIDVRDARTGEPIPDALIVGGVGAFFYPDSQPGPFGRPGVIPSFVVVNDPSEWAVRTGRDGTAVVQIAGGNPSSMLIIKDGYQATNATLEAGTTRSLEHAHWTTADPPQAVHGRPLPAPLLEFRVRDTGTR